AGAGVKKFETFTGIAAPLDKADVDTDQIIPKQFLRRIERSGFGPFLFFDWRKDPGFVLDQPAYAGARVLLTGPNFGCGSSPDPRGGHSCSRRRPSGVAARDLGLSPGQTTDLGASHV